MVRHALAAVVVGVAMLAAHTGVAEAEESPRFAAPYTSAYHVDPAWPRHLVNAEGEYLFIANKTAWAYFGCQDPAGYLARAKAQGISVIRVALEGQPYFKELGIELWPWGGTREQPDFGSFNEKYWEEVERRARLAGEQGIGLDVVLYFTLKPGAGDIERHKAYWQQAIKRLGKYPNVVVWEIQNEYLGNAAFQDAAGTFMKANDQRPVGTSDGTTDDAAWPDKAWVGMAINHSCTGSGGKYTLAEWYLPVARNTVSHGKPAFCNESGREKRHGNNDGVHRRKQGWLWCTAGGYWTWHSWDGCEGIDDAKYQAPGAEFIKPMAGFFGGLPFWKMGPNYTAAQVEGKDLVSAVLSEADRGTVLVYVCTEQTGRKVEGAGMKLRLPNGKYRVSFVSPRDGKVLEVREQASSGLRETPRVELPAFEDDLAVKIERTAGGSKTVIPGTE